jgi:TolB-like protein/DNA-binding winged helix-turn-helix (wHTH) protein/Tfp pilus assembly protein PilF
VAQSDHYRFGPFLFSSANHLLLRQGQPVALTPKAFEVLRVLLQRRGQLIEKNELLKAVWGDAFVEDAVLAVNVATIRRALGDSTEGTRYIETVPRLGYRFVAPVEVVVGPDDSLSANGKPSVAVPMFEPVTSEQSRRLRRILLSAVVVTIVAAAVAWLWWTRRQSAPRFIRSIAVLPLANLSRDPGQDYFADGMHEALITELSKIGGLTVISRTSTLRYREARQPLPAVARELNVDAVIEGSVLREGSEVRISVQLIDGASDHHLWADKYQRELRSVLSLHSEVAQAIAQQIKVTLTPQEQVRLATVRTVNPKAYELYALGRHYWHLRTLDGYRQAIERLQQALTEDPAYAPAYAALADCYMLLGEQGGMPQREAALLAGSAISKALELDETLAEAHASRGYWTLRYEWDWKAAEKALQRAIQLNPSYAAAHIGYGRLLGFAGRFEESQRELERARELDPLNVIARAYIAQVHLYARQYDRASDQLREALKLSPNHALLIHNLGELYMAQGRFDDAITQLSKAVELSSDRSSHYMAMLGCAYARANQRNQALDVLTQLHHRVERRQVSAFDMASLHIALGDNEQALDWLERGYQDRDGWLVELKSWPWFDPVRGDPRFQDLLRRTHFPNR